MFGLEYKLVGKWLKVGIEAKNQFSNKLAMYNYPGTDVKYFREFIPETVAVHRLNGWDQWLRVHEFFNTKVAL